MSTTPLSAAHLRPTQHPAEVQLPLDDSGFIRGLRWPAVETYGKEPRKVLALHGWLDNAGSFVDLARYFPKDVELVAIDLPGHGLSSHKAHGNPYLYLDWVRDVYHAVQDLQWSQFSLVGHSMGAGISTVFAGTFPEMVDKLVCLEGVLPIQQENPGDTQKYLRKSIFSREKLHAKKLQQRKASYGQEEPVSADSKPTRGLSKVEARDKLLKANSHLNAKSAEQLLVRGSREINNTGLLEFTRDLQLLSNTPLRLCEEQVNSFLRQLACEMTVILADGGLKYQDRLMERQLDICKGAARSFKLLRVPGSHHVHMNEPEVVGPLVREALGSQLQSKL
eukprot:m.17891 g.17891  ORF g.17891 m.17891 type:complete len:336 (+) comp11519_c0_seq1:160-1167(+)